MHDWDVLRLEATGICNAKTARNGRSQKNPGELSNLRFHNRKAVFPPQASSAVKKRNVSNSQRFFGFFEQDLITSSASLHGPGSWTLPSSCLFLDLAALAASPPAVVCVSPTWLLCHLWPSRSLLLSWKLLCFPVQSPPSCLFARLVFERHEHVSEFR